MIAPLTMGISVGVSGARNRRTAARILAVNSRVKWLSHVIVGAGIQYLDLVIFAVSNSQHKNRHPCVGAPNAPAGLDPSDSRHIDVEHCRLIIMRRRTRPSSPFPASPTSKPRASRLVRGPCRNAASSSTISTLPCDLSISGLLAYARHRISKPFFPNELKARVRCKLLSLSSASGTLL